MKSMKRFVVMMALALMVTVPFANSARAQNAVACTLAAADCKAIETADANIAKITSFRQDYDFSLKINAQGQATEVTSKGGGVFSLDAAAMTASDPTAALGALKLTLDVDGAVKSTTNQSGKVQVVITGGVIYFNDGTKWQGAKLADLLTQAMSSAGSSSNSAQMAQAQAFASDPAIVSSLAALPTIKGFITMEKAAGPDIGGVKTSAIVYKFDIKALLAGKDLYPLIKAIAKQSNPTGPEVTDAQIEQLAPLVSTVLKDSTITVTRYVGDDGLYHGLKLFVQLTIDGSMLGAAGAPIEAGLSLDVKLTKINEKVDVVAPAGAIMATPAK